MTDAPKVRPMTAADYRAADGPLLVTPASMHPTRDLVLGAIIGAAALWAVPKALDYLASAWLPPGGDDDFDLESAP